MKLRECFLVEFLFENGFGVWFVVQGFFQTDKKKNVAAANKQRNLNLCGLINFMVSITPAIGGNSMLMRMWVK